MSQVSEVDWSKPIEAYHTDGRICPATKVYGETSWRCDGHWWHSNRIDGSTGFDGWRIRNVAQPTLIHPTAPIPSEVGPEVVERMIALVRAVSEHGGTMVNLAEARAIVALMPEPVDADRVEVRRIVADALPQKLRAGILAGDEDHTVSITAPLACLKRGRALAQGGLS